MLSIDTWWKVRAIRDYMRAHPVPSYDHAPAGTVTAYAAAACMELGFPVDFFDVREAWRLFDSIAVDWTNLHNLADWLRDQPDAGEVDASVLAERACRESGLVCGEDEISALRRLLNWYPGSDNQGDDADAEVLIELLVDDSRYLYDDDDDDDEEEEEEEEEEEPDNDTRIVCPSCPGYCTAGVCNR